MKRVLCSLGLVFGLLLSGCGSAADNKPQTEVVLISEPEMENILSNSGWDIQSTSAASFHLWEQMNPNILLLAENAAEEVLIIGEFKSSEEAKMAYDSVVPLSDDSVTHSDVNGHLQAMIPLRDNQGYWLFRQAGKVVMGAWMESPDSEGEFTSIFDSFQTDAPVTEQSDSAKDTDSSKSDSSDAGQSGSSASSADSDTSSNHTGSSEGDQTSSDGSEAPADEDTQSNQ